MNSGIAKGATMTDRPQETRGTDDLISRLRKDDADITKRIPALMSSERFNGDIDAMAAAFILAESELAAARQQVEQLREAQRKLDRIKECVENGHNPSVMLERMFAASPPSPQEAPAGEQRTE